MPETEQEGLNEFEERIVNFFCDGVKMLGLPKSLGEIYGLLFVSPTALALDDLVSKLGISKGSASQGLRMLRELGAVKEAEGEVARRSYYKADVELKRLVGGFIKEEVRPHLSSGDEKLNTLKAMVAEMTDDQPTKELYEERVAKLGSWLKKARVVLPLLQKFLGS